MASVEYPAAGPDAVPPKTVDIDDLVDGQRFSRFNLNLLFWSFIATFADGFEISSLGLAAPHIVREWHVLPQAMGPMMSASLFGILIGAPLFGFLGDRYGRRVAITLGCLVFGATTLAVIWAGDTQQIGYLRFLTGIGMGGVMPNAIALSSELSPKKLRARLVILMFMGITLGATVPGLVSATLVPAHGWRTIFLIGGLAGLIAGAVMPFVLPESIKFYALRSDRQNELLRLARRMRRDLVLEEGTIFASRSRPSAKTSSYAPLFTDGLLPVTLLLWVCFATTLMANFFLSSWLPVLFEAEGIPPQTAALTAAMYQFGAVFGGLAMSILLDRIGFLAIALMLFAAAPALLAVGISDLPPVGLGFFVALAGFCVLGAQFGSNASAGLVYPTNSRSKGVGLALGIGRFGSVLGPIIGAKLIGLKWPMLPMLAAVAGPVLLGACAALALAYLNRARWGGWSLGERH